MQSLQQTIFSLVLQNSKKSKKHKKDNFDQKWYSFKVDNVLKCVCEREKEKEIARNKEMERKRAWKRKEKKKTSLT